MSLQEAFRQVCTEAKEVKSFYVALMEEVPYYGGPEEGGWWGSDISVVAYQRYDTEEAAVAAKEAVHKLAHSLSREEQRSYGETCQRETEWCEARGLDADYLPEPDGPTKYYVIMTDTLPEGSKGARHYE